MSGAYRHILSSTCAASLCAAAALAQEPPAQPDPPAVRAAVIPCRGLIDDALYRSIRRRTETAVDAGAQYLVYEIGTYGGLLQSADDISKYLIHEAAERAHTVAYVATEAISAGALISVSCRDIVMRRNTTIGDCAPIQLGGKLEGVEREKQESFVRAAFERAAEANGYPSLLLKAMVSIQTEVWRVRNLETSEYEFFDKERLPAESGRYDLEGAELIARDDELLTLTASSAEQYGVARAVVDDIDGAFDFLSLRDGVEFAPEPMFLPTTWSEEMVRWVNSPAVMGVLVMLALLGVYLELSTPGVGLPGLVAVVSFAVIVGSKYLTGLANWVEVAVFLLGIVLLLVEFFVLPGFGIAGVAGIACVLGGFFGMLVRNTPGELPWPRTDFDWTLFGNGILGLVMGVVAFTVLAAILTRYLPRVRFLSGLVLVPSVSRPSAAAPCMTVFAGAGFTPPEVGDIGRVSSTLRPTGRVRFGGALVDCVAEAEFIEKDTDVRVTEVRGNRVVVRALG
jgi:membrane-bound serine protease (ClpP class)